MIRVAIFGVGNCTSSLVQGLSYVKELGDEAVGVPFPQLGAYNVRDIDLVCAFDVDARKVGLDLSDAIFAEPNCTLQFFPDVPASRVIVQRGRTLDGVSAFMQNNSSDQRFELSDAPEPDQDMIVASLKKAGVEIVLNFLPVGSQQATEFYADCALKAGAAFINGIPVFIASDPVWAEKFKAAGLPIFGDDFKAQIGATIVHRTLMQLFELRGADVIQTYQLNVGGNTDFLNMMDSDRLVSKRRSKTESVQTSRQTRLADGRIRVGPSDYVAWLQDQKVAYIRMEGQLFGGAPVSVETRLSVEDSPNAAAMALIAIRCARIALDRKLAGPIDDVAAFMFKHPRQQLIDGVAHASLLRFAEG